MVDHLTCVACGGSEPDGATTVCLVNVYVPARNREYVVYYIYTSMYSRDTTRMGVRFWPGSRVTFSLDFLLNAGPPIVLLLASPLPLLRARAHQLLTPPIPAPPLTVRQTSGTRGPDASPKHHNLIFWQQKARRFLTNELRSQPSYREQSLLLRKGASGTPPTLTPPPSTELRSTASSPPPLSRTNGTAHPPLSRRKSECAMGVARLVTDSATPSPPEAAMWRDSRPPPLVLPRRAGRTPPAQGRGKAVWKTGCGGGGSGGGGGETRWRQDWEYSSTYTRESV